MEYNKKMVLEDGTVYEGRSFGSEKEVFLELVFNTSMVGYQEIISDPSYTDQAVVMTYPVIGNYGINDDDFETEAPSIGALIVREYSDTPSNFRCNKTLSEYMKEAGIVGIRDVDTREITRKIRDIGSCKVLITDIATPEDEAKKRLADWNYAHDQVSRVTVSGRQSLKVVRGGSGLHVVAIDCGMKGSIVQSLVDMGCDVTVVPFDTSFEDIVKLKPDGIFVSNGPGDPQDVKETIELLRRLHGKYPIFGICLGHQMLSLSYGAKTYKLKFGHRGGNHPVKNLLTDKIEITSQNHSYAVDSDSVKGTGLEITHLNLLDNTVEGVRHVKDRAFSVQYHPESAPGPQDSKYLFDHFCDLMKGGC
ncbi:MAG: glutamine-hydrolyzing carbamoyl-phosphate synthase small subunit [Lachnospiraceae bacterium]|nr:glutamine-hydrolyzing carbamoyl-phosphate synthase small subunit [Lachnospiraceae bacterium]